jgi:hypothetical protein
MQINFVVQKFRTNVERTYYLMSRFQTFLSNVVQIQCHELNPTFPAVIDCST